MFDYPDLPTPERRPFLDGLHEDEIATVVAHAQSRAYADGEAAVRRGEADRTVFVVTAGTFDVLREARRETGARWDSFGPGDIFGELAFFDGLPRSADVVARGSAEALLITPSGFERLRLNEPRLAVMMLMDLGRVVSVRLREYDRAAGARR